MMKIKSFLNSYVSHSLKVAHKVGIINMFKPGRWSYVTGKPAWSVMLFIQKVNLY